MKDSKALFKRAEEAIRTAAETTDARRLDALLSADH